MPSLNEYITTLRTYNPGITDKSISIYLLKDGWNIEEIEKAFAELRGNVSAPISVSTPVSASVSASAPTPVPTPSSAPAQRTSVSTPIASAISTQVPVTPAPVPTPVPEPTSTPAAPSMPVSVSAPVTPPSVASVSPVTPVAPTPSVPPLSPSTASNPNAMSSGLAQAVQSANEVAHTIEVPHTRLQEKMEELIHEREMIHEHFGAIPTPLTTQVMPATSGGYAAVSPDATPVNIHGMPPVSFASVMSSVTETPAPSTPSPVSAVLTMPKQTTGDSSVLPITQTPSSVPASSNATAVPSVPSFASTIPAGISDTSSMSSPVTSGMSSVSTAPTTSSTPLSTAVPQAPVVPSVPQVSVAPTVSVTPPVPVTPVAPIAPVAPVASSVAPMQATPVVPPTYPSAYASYAPSAVTSAPNAVPVVPSMNASQPLATPQSQNIPTKSSFGDPIATLRPKFSYQEVMGESPVAPSPVTPNTQSASSTPSVPITSVAQNVPSTSPYASMAGDSALAKTVVMPTMAETRTMMQAQGMSTGQIANATAPKKRGSVFMRILRWVFALALIGGIAFGYIRYVHGVYLFVQEPLDRERVLMGIVKSVAQINTASYDTELNLKVIDKLPGVEAFDTRRLEDSGAGNAQTTGANATMNTGTSYGVNSAPDTTGDSAEEAKKIDELLSKIPDEVSLQLGMNGMYKKGDDSQNGKLGFRVNGVFGSTTFGVDTDFIKLQDDTYAQINVATSSFFDIGSRVQGIIGTWIHITKQDRDNVLGSAMGFSDMLFDSVASDVLPSAERIETSTSTAKAQYLRILEIADEMQVVEIVGEPKKVRTADFKTVYEYELRLNLANFIAFAQTINVRLKSEFAGDVIELFTSEEIESLKAASTGYTYQYFLKNSRFVIGMQSNKFPVYFTNTTTFALQGGTEAKQLDTEVKVTLTDVNASIVIEAPQTSIPFDEAVAKIQGISMDELLIQKQVSAVQEVRNALRTYEAFRKEVPNSLSELFISMTALRAISDPEEAAFFANDTSLLLEDYVARDVYTKSLFQYTKTDTDEYQLVYNLPLAGLQKSTSTIKSLVEFLPWDKKGYMRFVPGTNTASMMRISEEAFAQSSIDADKDGLSDSLEVFMGTNPNKADSDGDKITDMVELEQEFKVLRGY